MVIAIFGEVQNLFFAHHQSLTIHEKIMMNFPRKPDRADGACTVQYIYSSNADYFRLLHTLEETMTIFLVVVVVRTGLRHILTYD